MKTAGEILGVVSDASAFPRSGRGALTTFGWVIGFGLVVSACMGPDVEPEVDGDAGTTHALITIDHRASNDGDEEQTQAAALAGFAQMPIGMDSEAVLKLAGWSLELPEVGDCLQVSTAADQDTPLAPIDQVELLEVGDVIIAGDGEATRLAPRAFTGSDVLTGVLYTSRDPSAEPFAPGAFYQVHTSGGALPALEFEAQAPTRLTNVTIGGVPLAEVEVVELDEPIDLTWNVGASDDLLYAELASDDGLHNARCAFHDSDGAGSVPEGAFTHSGSGTLSIHRLRSIGLEGEGLLGELRIDLEALVEVTYSK